MTAYPFDVPPGVPMASSTDPSLPGTQPIPSSDSHRVLQDSAVRAGRPVPPVGKHQLNSIVERLSSRDTAILNALGRVRVLTGEQLTRLFFTDLSPHTRDRLRRRVLGRLVSLGLVATLDRQIGGVRAGSSGLVYALSAAGQRSLVLLGSGADSTQPTRARKPWTPGVSFLKHSLTVSELYVQLSEAERSHLFEVITFVAEPASWLPNSLGGFVKPDGYLLVARSLTEQAWAIEVDRATESITTLRRKLLAYVDFARTGQVGPDGMTPRVLVTVPDQRRLDAVKALVADLPEPATQLIFATLFDEALLALIGFLEE